MFDYSYGFEYIKDLYIKSSLTRQEKKNIPYVRECSPTLTTGPMTDDLKLRETEIKFSSLGPTISGEITETKQK